MDLGDAAPINAAVFRWRQAIESQGDDVRTAAELKRLVWDKVATTIPAGVNMLYLALDGDLARTPSAALPMDSQRVLLDQFTIAQVPYGAFLFERLQLGTPIRGASVVLALGGVDYGRTQWPALPGTNSEVQSIAAMAPAEKQILSGREATTERLKALLGPAEYVHPATHGRRVRRLATNPLTYRNDT